MTRIPSDLSDIHKIRLKELEQKQRSPSFKKIIGEARQNPRKKAQEEDEEKGKECVISIFELPSHHFDLNDAEDVGCQVPAAPPAMALTGTCENKGPAAISPVQIPAEIEALFEKMAGTMLLLSSSGENETTLFLNAPQFDQSPFYGTRITIKEFSTAPRAFNVEIAASSVALAQLNAHKSALLDAFTRGNFNFSIGRLDTEIQETERPLFHRKGPVSQDEGDV